MNPTLLNFILQLIATLGTAVVPFLLKRAASLISDLETNHPEYKVLIDTIIASITDLKAAEVAVKTAPNAQFTPPVAPVPNPSPAVPATA